ncbi:MAG: S9 family peptidase [Frankiaceae bacterium]
MKPTDLAALRIPSQPAVSPDGRFAAVTVTRLDLDEDEYRSQLWLVPTDGGRARALTHGHRDGRARWSPDGRWVAFLRAGKDEPPQLHVMPSDGGEGRRVTDQQLGVSDFAWAPDSTRVAFVARVPEAGRYERGPDARPPAKEAPRRITTFRYRYDNAGFIHDRPSHVFVVDALAEDAEPVQLTKTDWQFDSPVWTPDGNFVVFASDRHDIESSLTSDLFVAPAEGGDVRQVTRSTTLVSSPAISADGTTAYFLGTERLDVAGRTAGAFSVPLDGSAEPTRLTDAERWDLSDSHHDGPLIPTPDGLLALASRRGTVELVRLSYDGGEPTVLTSDRHMLTGLAVAGDTIVVVESTDTSAGELAVLDGEKLRVISDIGGEFQRGVALRPMTELTATASDGYEVHGWVVKPAGPGPHPVLLTIHGGPFTQYGYALFDEAQVYAGAGYAVVLGNPRGASGYGEAHGRAIIGDWGDKDRLDLMTLLDAALADPDLDADRVGVLGGSYGGFMTTWLAAHEGSRFRGAIVERALTAFDSFTGSSDIGWFFTKVYAGEDPAQVAKQSPLTHADRIDIPTLIIHSEQDWRCPVEQAQRLFVALKLRGVRTELLLFPAEGHELSRSGLPSHRLARFDAILQWWAEHLGPRE